MIGRSGVWLSKITALAGTSFGSKYVRTTRFASIGAGTSGTVTLPSFSTVVLDDFGGTTDAIVTQISSGKPTLQPALTASGVVVATTFDSSGNWALSGTPTSYPVAIVYRVKQSFANFDSDASDLWGVPAIYGKRDGYFGVTIDGAGLVLTTGVKGYVRIPYDCTIESWSLLADQSGSIVIDVWKDTYANFPPTVADTITASAKPTLSATNKNATLTGWSKTLAAGDVVGFKVDSASTLTRAHLILNVSKL